MTAYPGLFVGDPGADDLYRALKAAYETGASLTLHMECTGWAASLSADKPNKRYVLEHAESMLDAVDAVVAKWNVKPSEKCVQISDDIDPLL